MAGADKKIQPIVIKRIKKAAHGHHGGAWKIAYADFVTAMMAFFLLMWLLGSTTKGDLKGISDYFSTPLKIAMAGGSGAGDSSSVVKGGGTDLSRTIGNRNMEERLKRQKKINLMAARHEFLREEHEKLTKLRGKLQETIQRMPGLAEFKDQIRLEITADGLSIQIIDAKNRPMFASGSAVVQSYMRDLLRGIGLVLNEVDNPVSLTGHTDATPYSGGNRGYSNWELSAERANASRRELIAGGMKDDKVLRVTGVGPVTPLDAKNPTDPINRRIAIVVLNSIAQDRILRGTELSAEEEEAVRSAIVANQARTASGGRRSAAEGGGASEGPDASEPADAKGADEPAATPSATTAVSGSRTR